MAASLTLRLLGDVVSGNSGTKHIEPPAITSATATERTLVQTLATGDNTIAVPTTATVCVIVPPPGNTQVITLKGSAGDTGIVISKTNWTSLAFDTTPPASIIVNAAGTVALVTFNFG